jgi:hypothetical protein
MALVAELTSLESNSLSEIHSRLTNENELFCFDSQVDKWVPGGERGVGGPLSPDLLHLAFFMGARP